MAIGTLGVGWTTSAEETLVSVKHLTAEDAMEAVSKGWSIQAWLLKNYERLNERAREQDREDNISDGALVCKECDTVFYPSPYDKSAWVEYSCCSKICLLRHKPELKNSPPPPPSADKTAPPPANKIALTCLNGHAFAVPKMFSGAIRKCPECGEKTDVP